MKVPKTGPIAKTYGVAPRRKTGAPSITSTRSPEDVASIMGIPEAELTPQVRTAMMVLMEEVDTLRHELEAAKSHIDELASLADQDPLLPRIFNRRAFVREMSRTMSFAERYEMESSLIYFDLNNFKSINDEYGHGVGDQVLMSVGEILLKNVRDSDVVGRLGGDEFGVVLAKADQKNALLKAESLAKQIHTATIDVGDGKKVAISSSFGAYTFQKGAEAKDAIDAADKAMFQAKREFKSGD